MDLIPSNLNARQELIGKEFDVLDFGKIVVMEVMGCDRSIVDNARTSYHTDSTKSYSDDDTLLRYLFRHRHSTPTETGNQIKLFVSLPITVERQWARHRTAAWNEVSARYSVLPEKFYLPRPENVCYQDKKNRQGRAEQLEPELAARIISEQRDQCEMAFSVYNEHCRQGVARELARDILPFCTYTEKVWSISLHNLFHFLGLRMDGHAQYEIRAFADIIGNEIVSKLWPISWKAFLDYRLNAMSLTALDIKMVKKIAMLNRNQPMGYDTFCYHVSVVCPQWNLARCRERDECFEKMVALNLCEARNEVPA